jgi:hypothetical protein
MSTVVYTKIKDLETNDREIFEFGNWLNNFNEDRKWIAEEEEWDDTFEQDSPTNKKGETMEYPWDDFTYVVVPDSPEFNNEAEDIAAEMGSYQRYDIEDSDRTFFVVQ